MVYVLCSMLYETLTFRSTLWFEISHQKATAQGAEGCEVHSLLA